MPEFDELFNYTPDERDAVGEALRAGPSNVDKDTAKAVVDLLEREARFYVDWQTTAQALPDKDRMQQRAQEHSHAINAVKSGILRAKGVPFKGVDETASLDGLVSRLQRKLISSTEFEATVAFQFLASGRVKMEILDTWLTDDNHWIRRKFLEEITLCWMTAHSIKLPALRIAEGSKGVGGRLLEFVQAASRPVLTVTHENIGARMICNIIRDVKRAPSPWAAQRLGLIDEYPPRK